MRGKQRVPGGRSSFRGFPVMYSVEIATGSSLNALLDAERKGTLFRLRHRRGCRRFLVVGLVCLLGCLFWLLVNSVRTGCALTARGSKAYPYVGRVGLLRLARMASPILTLPVPWFFGCSLLVVLILLPLTAFCPLSAALQRVHPNPVLVGSLCNMGSSLVTLTLRFS